MPKIDLSECAVRATTIYPAEYAKVTEGRIKTVLGNAAGLTQFGVNLTRLKPGAASALRHWHETEDEFVYIVEGEATLCEDGGETILRAGDCAGFKAGVAERPLSDQQVAERRGLSRDRHARAGRPVSLFRRRHDGRQERDAACASCARTAMRSGEGFRPPRRGAAGIRTGETECDRSSDQATPAMSMLPVFSIGTGDSAWNDGRANR